MDKKNIAIKKEKSGKDTANFSKEAQKEWNMLIMRMQHSNKNRSVFRYK